MHDPRAEQPERFAHFLASFPRASARLLVLTYDGTLAPLQVNRDRATPYPGVRTALNQILLAGRTRIVIVSLVVRHRPCRRCWASTSRSRSGAHTVQSACSSMGYLPSLLTPGAAVAYLGDDLSDEGAFIALEGRGLTVLVRHELRPTVTQAWLLPPDELLVFMTRWRLASAPTSWLAGGA